MDYEKKYKEALERAREWYNKTEPDSYTCIVESIFPELKESEDEKCIRLCTDIINSALRAGFCVQLDRDRCIDWLQSLKQRATWKPSEEQMEALESATENCAYSEYQDCLKELIVQLKKL